MNVSAWLRELGLGQCIQAFRDKDVDGETLRRLPERDLADIGVKSIGHRRKLCAAIGNLADSARMGQGWCDAELWRVRGVLLAQGPRRDDAQAASSFEQAVTIARASAGLQELRDSRLDRSPR